MVRPAGEIIKQTASKLARPMRVIIKPRRFGRFREWLICLTLGAGLALLAVYWYTGNDQALKKLANTKALLIENTEQARRASAKSKADFEKKFATQEKITSTKRAELKDALKQTFDGSQNPQALDSLPASTKTNYLSQLKAYQAYTVELEKENLLLRDRILALELELNASYTREQEAIDALNESYRTAKAYATKQRAMKIGLGVAIPLAIAGGVVAGFYAGGVF